MTIRTFNGCEVWTGNSYHEDSYSASQGKTSDFCIPDRNLREPDQG